MTLHLETLSPALNRALRALGPVCSSRGFHLAGGTGLALRLGHRRSEDADWFRTEPITDPATLGEEIGSEAPGFVVTDIAPNTLHGAVGRAKCSWFGYPYPLLAPADPVPELGMAVASLDDIAAMKLAAVAQRGSRKDFMDVHALCAHHRPLSELLGLYERRYGIEDAGHVLIGLTYFDDAEREPAPHMSWPGSWPSVKRDLVRWVRDALASGSR